MLSAFRWVVLVSACAYPLTLVAALLLMRVVGESWWLGTASLYLPRQPWLLPLLPLVVALLVLRRARWLWTQAFAGFLALFPLLGFVLPQFALGDEEAATLRVMSFNVDSGFAGREKVLAAIRSTAPDILFLQETKVETEYFGKALRTIFRYVEVQPYSIVASRYPLVETTPQHKLSHDGRERSQRFQRHAIRTELGGIAVYNVHPISPRGALNMYRFRGAFSTLRRGEAISEDSKASLQSNATLRRAQVEALARAAKNDPLPVILAGDFNLPELSPIFHDNLGDFQDGFRQAGSGFGFTYPAKFPWMRLDRVLASEHFSFSSFETGCRGLSDHLCVVAELRRR